MLASIAAAVGLVAADWTLTWGIESAYADKGGGGAPFWMTSGLELTTILYASGLAVVSAAMLSLLPALRATRARVQSNLANLGTGGATLRFGRVWTSVMIAQVALTAMGIPVAMESASQIDAHAEEPRGVSKRGVSRGAHRGGPAVRRGDRRRRSRIGGPGRSRRSSGASRRNPAWSRSRSPTACLGPRSREPGSQRSRGCPATILCGHRRWPRDFSRHSIVRLSPGVAFTRADRSPAARTVIVNEAFAREFRRHAGRVSPIGARLRYVTSSARIGRPALKRRRTVARDRRRRARLRPGSRTKRATRQPFVFRAASAGTVSPLVMSVRVRGNPAPLVARLPVIAASVDAGLYVQEARPLDEWIRRRGA